MKRVFIHAYAAGNLGDDLLVRILCERYPRTKFLIWADPSYKIRFADLKNLRVFSLDDKVVRYVNRISRRLKKCDNGMWKLLLKSSYATVHIGGSVFVQHQDDFSPAYELDRQLRRLSRRLFVVGANFGPYTDESYYDKYKELFQFYDGICFRDSYSKRLFGMLSNIRFAPDVAFNYRGEGNSVKVKKQVLFSVIYMESRGGKYSISQYAEEYYTLISSLAEAYIERGYSIKFISFCRMEEDEKAIKIVMDGIRTEYRKALSTYFYDMDGKGCVDQFYESEIVVGTRFHSIILGWMAKKKVLPIVYNMKTLHTLEDMGIKDYILMEELGKVDVNNVADELMGREAVNVEELKKEAEIQFLDLDRILS